MGGTGVNKLIYKHVFFTVQYIFCCSKLSQICKNEIVSYHSPPFYLESVIKRWGMLECFLSFSPGQ